MIFVHPLWLAVGAVACLALLWTWRRHDARQRRALGEFVSAHLSGELTRSLSPTRRRLRRASFALAVALLFAALAEPQYGFRWEQVKRRGNDIVFAVDTSRSMLTPDVKPDRLTRAKLAIDDFVGRLDGDAVGLVAFAGSAFLQCPLTVDYGAFQESLAALDTHIIPLGGTDISSAIQAALAAVRNRAGSDKILILLTDGEDLEGNALQTAQAAAKAGLKIYTVGVGTANGDLIPLPADQGGGFLKDGDGRFVRSRLDEKELRAIAEATGGAYAPLGASNQGLDVIYREAIAPLVKHDLTARTERVYLERYQWPLAASLVLLLMSLVVGSRRRVAVAGQAAGERTSGARAGASGQSPRPSGAAAFPLVLLGLVALLPIQRARASEAGSAASAYRQGDYAAAQKDYAAAAARDPSPVLKFDAGTAAYKAGDFPAAAEQFQASLGAARSGSAQRLAEQQDAYYNLGNALYREGQKTATNDPQKTMQSWNGALKAYDAALQLRANDADSKFNRDFVNRKLQQLKQQQQQQKQQKQQKQSQQGGKQSQASQGGDSSGSQQPQQSPQGQQGQQPQRSQQGQQPQQAQQGQQPGPSPQQPQSGESPGKREGPITSAANSQQTGQNPQEGADQDQPRIPGQMSPEEARELLDSVKDEERRSPTAPSAQNSEGNTLPVQPSRDW